MMATRYAARYDGKAWGVWDRHKECWLLYPVTSDEARQSARDQNTPVSEKKPSRKIETTQDMPAPTYTNILAERPGLGIMPPLQYREPKPPRPDFGMIMSNIGNPAQFMGPRAMLGAMLAGMQDEIEEIRERELARLPVQPLAIPICSHCAEIELRKRSRN